MGTEIHLCVGAASVAFGKNEVFPDFGHLFAPQDRQERPHWGGVTGATEPILIAKLRDIVPRLRLLGWSLTACARNWEAAQSVEINSADFDFDRLMAVFRTIDLSPTGVASRDVVGFRLDNDVAATVAFAPSLSDFSADRRLAIGKAVERLFPEALLRLIAESPTAYDLDVTWDFAEHVEAGWSEESDHCCGPEADDVWTIVTEGSSDTAVLRRALGIVHPGVAQFFQFIDMDKNYPFGGTGNLANFIKGLVKLRYRDRVLVIVDNDCAGRSAEIVLRGLPLPSNIYVMRLPDLPIASAFPTIGPSGIGVENVNGRAVSIEMFLDLRPRGSMGAVPRIRWTTYDQNLDDYQGVIEGKGGHVQRFVKGRLPDDYDMSGLRGLWSSIIERCESLAEIPRLSAEYRMY